ncbi:MAG: response regulator, partial [Algicola sp.]|nr:response regulator [Algicola sp.]
LNTRGLETLGGAITNHDDQLMAGFMSNIANVQQQSIPFIIADQSFNLILQTDQAVQLKAIAQQRNQLLQVATPFLLIIFAIFYYVVYKQLLVRINKLDAGTQKFAEGDFKFQLEVSGRDELSQLSRSFNTLGQRLLNARTNLESKVEQRTFELTQSNQKLEAAIKEATEANQIKSEFLASMSHEIRTPMNGVLGMIDLLQNSPLNEKQSHFTHLAKTSADALLCVINDILDFSKIEAGMLNLEMIEFDLEAMFGDFAETFAIAAEQKPIEFILNMSQVRCLQVRGDPGRLRQILNNIVGNALKFTLKGEIEITVATKQIDDFELLTCLVRDTGIGIPKSALSNLFNAFTQVDSSTTRKYGGTGLGLAIVSQLCQLMGGKISATSELGKGSIFAIEILLNKTASENVKITQPNLTGKHMMMVDDNQTCRNMMEQQLTSWGANVTKACDAQAAQLLFENAPLNTFDVAIIDADMPGTNGETLIRQLTKRQLVGQTKLVLCTPINNTDDTALFRELGCAGYLHKPLRISTLHQLLGNIDELSFSAPFEAGLEENPEDSAPKPAETRPQTPITPKVQYRILLVEDNQINQVVAHEVLKRLGLVVSIANNGQEALNLLNAGGDPCPYDLIIMDCQMPVMDGYQATDSIRKGLAGKCNEQITIIAMTANVMSGDEEKCLSCGMNDYFSKPIVPDLLKTKLRQYLPDL